MNKWVLYDSMTNAYLCDQYFDNYYPSCSTSIVVKMTKNLRLGALLWNEMLELIDTILYSDIELILDIKTIKNLSGTIKNLSGEFVFPRNNLYDNLWAIPVDENGNTFFAKGFKIEKQNKT